MEKQKATYYQYQAELNYQVYLRLEGAQLQTVLAETLDIFGFSKVEEEDLKKIAFNKGETRVLKVSEANARVAKQIQRASGGLESFGPESISNHGNYQLYRYQSAGMMVFSESSPTWELGLVRPEANLEKVKAMLVRFLSWALASKGVVGFWAVPVEQGFVVMKPVESNYEAVFVDIEQMSLITYEGIRPIEADLQILRLDETLRNESKTMSREALLSYLTTNTSHFSYHGVTGAMRKSLLDLASFATGVVYPVENFRPRRDLQQAG